MKDLKRSADDTPHFLCVKGLWAGFIELKPFPDAQAFHLVPGKKVNIALHLPTREFISHHTPDSDVPIIAVKNEKQMKKLISLSLVSHFHGL
mgnify:CR=1 FL=1